MNIVSTHGGALPTSLSVAIVSGLAPDGGLFMPESLPRLSMQAFDGTASLSGIASILLRPFFADDMLAEHLDSICAEAFTFDAPLRRLATPDDYVLELFHGPTAAFKDFGARFLAACMRRLRSGEKKPLTIIVATSGDTGAAVAAAFYTLPHFRVIVLYPDGRVSPRQAHQLGCFGDNVRALRVAGSFDDCQHLAKLVLADSELQHRVPLSSANSISLGRLLPQMAYYAQASLAHFRLQNTLLNFVVPTGNLGNAVACVMARAMGLPIGRIVFSTNANQTLRDFFAGREYTPRPSVSTLANAMDVGAPSNFERLRWLYPERELRHEFIVDAVGDDAIRTTLRDRHAKHAEVFCPHTATAIRTLENLRQEGAQGSWAAVATAHPAKFEQVVEPLIGSNVRIPPSLEQLLRRPSSSEAIAADVRALHGVLLAR
ncbi:MAG TPA: threonine synthase [Rudaea sp.]|jgi:threonine synthase|nr:threonine synthase [Rudaea sp.]